MSFLFPEDPKTAAVHNATVWDSLVAYRSRPTWDPTNAVQDEVQTFLTRLTSSQLAPMSQGLAALGLFQRAQVSRQMALQRSIREFESQGTNRQVARRAFFAHLEDGDISSALQVAERIRLSDGELPQEVLMALTALGLTPDPTTSSWQSPADDRFSELVAGRRVLIVGAAPIDEEYIADGGDYDCVVRMTPTPAAEIQSGALERRCDIAYMTRLTPDAHRSLDSRFRSTGLKLHATATPKLIVMKKAYQMNSLAGVPIRSVPNLRVAAIGSPTSGTQAVVDLVRYHPRSLDLCGFNFYTSSQIYSPEIQAAKRSAPQISGAGRDFHWTQHGLHPSIHSIQWAAHDLASDFMLLKSVIRHNSRVRAMGRAADVLQWSLERYYQRFDELHRGLS